VDQVDHADDNPPLVDQEHSGPPWTTLRHFPNIDNVNASTLRAALLAKHTTSYLVDWVSSFLSERSCTLVFQGSSNLPPPVSVGTPHGSPISPLLFLLYVAPFHLAIPKGIMLSYVDDFSITVASMSYWDNLHRLQRTYTEISDRGRSRGVSFSVPITELIHWRTPSQGTPHATNPIQLDGQLFHPKQVIRWLSYWLAPALTATHHYRDRLSLAQAAFSFVKRLSFPGAGVRPFVCHRVTQGLLLP